MKKLTFGIIALLAAFCVVAKLSYNRGYSDGRFDFPTTTYIEVDNEEEYFKGYDEGYSEGFYNGENEGYSLGYELGAEQSFADHGYTLLYLAEKYAADNSQWHPVEAWELINSYRNCTSFFSDGSPPSEKDYYDAVDSLICFYDYFCSSKFD